MEMEIKTTTRHYYEMAKIKTTSKQQVLTGGVPGPSYGAGEQVTRYNHFGALTA